MHFYIVVRCKTPNCAVSHILLYLGENSKAEEVEYWIPYPLMIECPRCGQTHDYSDSEKQFYTAELQEGPPPAYSDKLKRSLVPQRISQPTAGSMVHYYLYADCKTPGCKARLWLSHLEMPDARLITVDYPDEWFPVGVACGSCGQTHSYEAREIGTQSAYKPHRPVGWKPILPDPYPYVKRQDTN